MLSVLFLIAGPGLRPDSASLPIEAARYLQMAGWDPGVPLPEPNFPSKYRVVTPYLVGLLPVDPVVGFHVTTVLFLTLFVTVFKYVLELLGLDDLDTVFGAALCLSLFYPTIYYVGNPFMTDPLFLLLWAVAIVLVLTHRPWLLALVIAVGVLNKETIVFVMPVCLFVWFDRSASLRSLVKSGAVAVPGVAVYLGMRMALSSEGAGAPMTVEVVLAHFASTLLSPVFLRSLVTGALLAGGALWPFVLLHREHRSALLWRYLLGGIAAVAPLLLLAADSGRQFAILALFWIPVVLSVWSRRFDRRARVLAVASAAASNLVLVLLVGASMSLPGKLVGVAVACLLAWTPFILRPRAHAVAST